MVISKIFVEFFFNLKFFLFVKKLRYNEFLSFPYLKEVSLRKISYQEENGKISKRIYKTLKEMDPNVENKTMFVEKR